MLTIAGFGFDTVSAGNAVVFNLGAAGVVTDATTTQLTVKLSTPPTSTGALTAVVTLTSFNVSSGAAVQVATVVEAPNVFGTSFRLAQSATMLTINGANFDPTAAENTVSFTVGWSGNDRPVGVVIAATSTQLNVSLSIPPTGRGPLAAQVTSFGGTSRRGEWVAYVVDPPSVTETSVTLAQTATILTIDGSSFVPWPYTPGNEVAFNLGAAGVVTDASSTQLTVKLSTQPTSTGALTAVVTSYGGSSGAPVKVAEIKPAPRIKKSSNRLHCWADWLVIEGSGFDPEPSGNSVFLNQPGSAGWVAAATDTLLLLRMTDISECEESCLSAVVTSFGGTSGDPVLVAETHCNHDWGKKSYGVCTNNNNVCN
jgi:hypothetical protein